MFHHTPKISTFLISFLSSATISMSSIPTLLSHSNLLHILVMFCWYSQASRLVRPVSPLWPPLWNVRSADAEISTGRKSCNHSSLLLSQQSTPKIFLNNFYYIFIFPCQSDLSQSLLCFFISQYSTPVHLLYLLYTPTFYPSIFYSSNY
ncbi:uncharacterized protein VICG_00860 [Vittaforma corneae ATCC 50505]|uniref:Uncharacterized protein n=1 Tax=Vittaforma corneae (strain ATCC 50505) TaxID=993615 RepID=L2GPI6_VITCO|nr:uncharacterized protein VICG_00860 [Vittaforma corneae ATCC 50505]ELA42217.1 hypothetical protein VICG_00860 [Vittaforma corneae ATCC 50505]